MYIRADYVDQVVSQATWRQREGFFQQKFAKYSSPESHVDCEYVFDDVQSFLECPQVNFKGVVFGKTAWTVVDHEVIGGAKLPILKEFLHILPMKDTDMFYHTKWWYVFPALKLWWNRTNIPKVEEPLEMITHRDSIRRFRLNYEMDKGRNLKATILMRVMRTLHTALHLDRPLVVYLPIAFLPTPTVNNNIGIIFLTYTPGDTVETISQQLNNNKYQVLATNFLLYYKFLGTKHGTNTRKSVDAVITMIITEDCENVQVGWTFKNVSDYPVYVSVSPVIDRVRGKVYVTETLTVSTPVFQPSEEYTEVGKEFFLIE
jgi:hypothetical protein